MHKVVIVLTGYNPSTMEKCHLMANGLEMAGIRTHLIGFSDEPEKRMYFKNVFLKSALYTYEYGSERRLHQGGHLINRLANNTYMMIRYFIKLFIYLVKEKPEAVILPTQPIQVVLSTAILCRIMRVLMVPNIMEYYPAMPSFKKKINYQVRMSWWIVMRCSDAFIVISEYLYEKIRFQTKKRIFRLPALLPQTKCNEGCVDVCSGNGDKALLLYSSSRGYEELLEFCIQSLSLIKDKNYKLFITGKYSDSEISKWSNIAKENGVNDKVKFCGYLTDAELLTLQKRSHALLMPLINNERHKARFPQKILSYMQLGKPVVTTGVGEMIEYFNDNENIIMDKTVTVNGYSEKISLVLENQDSAIKIGENGKRYVEERFNMMSWGEELKRFIQGLREV